MGQPSASFSTLVHLVASVLQRCADVLIPFSRGQSTILSLVLLLVAVLNALYLFSRTRSYRLQMRANPASVGSPNARVVDLDEPIDSNPFNGGGGGGGPSHEAEDGRGWIQKAKDGKVWLAGGRMLLSVFSFRGYLLRLSTSLKLCMSFATFLFAVRT